MVEVKTIPKKTVTIIQPKTAYIVDKQKHRQTRMAAYCRVSTDFEDQLNSFENQKEFYTDKIAKNPEWCLVEIYADEGISGTLAEKRPAFMRMIDDCLNGKIDYIMVKAVSRFARNTIECLHYVNMLKEHGVGVIFEDQNIDTLDLKSQLYLTIYAGFAQSESESISKNVIWTVRNKFAEGKVPYIYKKFLGYKKGEDGIPEIVPEEAAIVVRIYDMFLAGATPKAISDTLTAENVTVLGKNFTFAKNTVISILTNIKYCGDAILQQTHSLDCISKKRVKNTGENIPMYYVHNAHPAIIPRATFNKVQEEIARRKTSVPKSKKTAYTASGRYSRYALTEVLMCGECGTRYRRVTWSKKGKKKVVWRCINRLDYGTKYCNKSLTVEESVLHEAIVRAIEKFNKEDASTYFTLMKATIGDAIGMNGSNDEIDLLERRIRALNDKMLSIVNESVATGGDVESHENEFKEISEEIEQLNKRIQAIRESFCDAETAKQRLEYINRTIDERMHNSGVYDDSIVRQMVECIKIYHDGRIEVIFGGGTTIDEQLTAEED